VNDQSLLFDQHHHKFIFTQVKATIKKKKDPTPATRISGRSKKAVNYKEKTEADVESAEENEETVTKSCGSTDVKRWLYSTR